MKVGDLVRFKRVHPFKKLGVVVSLMDPNWEKVDPCQWPSVNVTWNGKYGTFWTQIQHLELLNESR